MRKALAGGLALVLILVSLAFAQGSDHNKGYDRFAKRWAAGTDTTKFNPAGGSSFISANDWFIANPDGLIYITIYQYDPNAATWTRTFPVSAAAGGDTVAAIPVSSEGRWIRANGCILHLYRPNSTAVDLVGRW